MMVYALAIHFASTLIVYYNVFRFGIASLFAYVEVSFKSNSKRFWGLNCAAWKQNFPTILNVFDNFKHKLNNASKCNRGRFQVENCWWLGSSVVECSHGQRKALGSPVT